MVLRVAHIFTNFVKMKRHQPSSPNVSSEASSGNAAASSSQVVPALPYAVVEPRPGEPHTIASDTSSERPRASPDVAPNLLFQAATYVQQEVENIEQRILNQLQVQNVQ